MHGRVPRGQDIDRFMPASAGVAPFPEPALHALNHRPIDRQAQIATTQFDDRIGVFCSRGWTADFRWSRGR
jgi:hypothetical protein